MKKKDILPTLGRGFIVGTLGSQAVFAYQAGKLGSVIGLAAALIIFVAMNYQSFCCCSSKKDCDIGEPKTNAV